LIIGGARDAQAAGFAQSFKPRGNIHTIAIDVVPIDNDVADVDANPEEDALIFRYDRISTDHAALNSDRAGHGINDTRVLDKHAIACRLDDATMVGCNHRIDKGLAVGLERLQRPDFVSTHKTAVTGDIGRDNCRKLALDPLLTRLMRHVPDPSTASRQTLTQTRRSKSRVGPLRASQRGYSAAGELHRAGSKLYLNEVVDKCHQ
jgi:hypothetical protein